MQVVYTAEPRSSSVNDRPLAALAIHVSIRTVWSNAPWLRGASKTLALSSCVLSNGEQKTSHHELNAADQQQNELEAPPSAPLVEAMKTW